MDKLLSMMGLWHPFLQWLFLVFIVMVVFATVNNLFRLGVVLFRGWPQCVCQMAYAEEIEEEEKE